MVPSCILLRKEKNYLLFSLYMWRIIIMNCVGQRVGISMLGMVVAVWTWRGLCSLPGILQQFPVAGFPVYCSVNLAFPTLSQPPHLSFRDRTSSYGGAGAAMQFRFFFFFSQTTPIFPSSMASPFFRDPAPNGEQHLLPQHVCERGLGQGVLWLGMTTCSSPPHPQGGPGRRCQTLTMTCM